MKLPSDPISAVAALTNKFEASTGQRNVSAASKLLWMKLRHPIVIYDRRAADALSCTRNVAYEEFHDVWLTHFEMSRTDIDKAAKGLKTIPRSYTAAHALDDATLDALVEEKWFKARIFDIWLWETGRQAKNM